MSKTIKNKKQLKDMVEANKPKAIEEKITNKKIMSREFKCLCGCTVKLEGDIAQDLSIKQCTECRRKDNK